MLLIQLRCSLGLMGLRDKSTSDSIISYVYICKLHGFYDSTIIQGQLALRVVAQMWTRMGSDWTANFQIE